MIAWHGIPIERTSKNIREIDFAPRTGTTGPSAENGTTDLIRGDHSDDGTRSEESLAKTFDRVAEIYDATRKYPEDIMDTILNALEKVLQKEGRILDAGVGTGRFAQPLQLRGYEVVGVDVSPRMLAKAVGKGTQDLIKGDVCFLPFKDESFRVTLSVHVMHLISSWRCALGEIGRVTTDSLVSVAFAKEESAAEDLRNLYDKACKEAGFELRHPGLRERELTEILAPDFSRYHHRPRAPGRRPGAHR